MIESIAMIKFNSPSENSCLTRAAVYTNTKNALSPPLHAWFCSNSMAGTDDQKTPRFTSMSACDNIFP